MFETGKQTADDLLLMSFSWVAQNSVFLATVTGQLYAF